MTLDDLYEIGRIRSRSASFLRKWEHAVDLAAEQMETHKSAYAAISGGKDSGVLASVVAEASRRTGRECRLWAYVSDASFPGTTETITAIAEYVSLPLDLEVCPTSAFEALSQKQRPAFGKTGSLFYDAVREYSKDKDLAFVGVRAYESKRRMKAARVHGETFHSRSMGNVDSCYPLTWFKLEDIAAATVMENIPLHPIYSKQQTNMSRNKFGEDSFIRLGYAVNRDLLKYGTTVFMRVNYPEIYEKVAAVYPEIRNET